MSTPTKHLAAAAAALLGLSTLIAAAPAGAANTARHAYELWDTAGLLPVAGRELCRRVAAVLERFAAAECGGTIEAEVALVDFSGMEVVART